MTSDWFQVSRSSHIRGERVFIMQMGPAPNVHQASDPGRGGGQRGEWQKLAAIPWFVSWTLDLSPDSLTRVRGFPCLVRSLMCLAYPGQT